MEEKANVEIKKTIDRLEFLIDEDCSDTQFDYIEEIESAIKALTELQQYRAIGTLEECRTAREKQILMKPKTNRIDSETIYCKCPSCNITTVLYRNCIMNYCKECGQKLDWSGENETD